VDKKNVNNKEVTKLDLLIVSVCLINFFIPFILKASDIGGGVFSFFSKGQYIIFYYVITYFLIGWFERKYRIKKITKGNHKP